MNKKDTLPIGLSSFHLKIIAVLSMLTDHTGYILYPEIRAFRYVGRLAFPLFCFQLTEGFCHTGDRKRYMARLAVFALISEIPFDLAFHQTYWDPGHQNVFFTLLIGVGMMVFMEREKDMFSQCGVMIIGMMAAELLHTDYGGRGILLIGFFYLFRERRPADLVLAGTWNLLWKTKIQYAGVLAVPLIALYNGKKGPGMKFFFYMFYPVHLLILYCISILY